MKSEKLYKKISSALNARANCAKSGNLEWFNKWEDKLNEYNDYLPSGSGFDSGSKIDIDDNNPDRIIIYTSYHFMDDNGYYDGWEDYKIVVKPSLLFDFTLTIHGVNRDDIKDYIYEVFDTALRVIDTESN